MVLNKYEKIAKKYLVDDFNSATYPGTTLSNILNQLEIKNNVFSNRAIEFLKQQKLLALVAYIRNECTFTEYLSFAKIEQINRRETVGKKPVKECLKQDKLHKKVPVRLHEYSNPPKNKIKKRTNRSAEGYG